jgi:hypothetical protein
MPRLALAVIVVCPFLAAQAPRPTIADESKVTPYVLPDPLVTRAGVKVTSANAWRGVRRPELMRLFASEMFGRTPDAPPPALRYEVVEKNGAAFHDAAVRRQVRIHFTADNAGPHMDLLILLPAGAKAGAKVPAFLGLNFGGNQTVAVDPAIAVNAGAPAGPRSAAGGAASQWQAEMLVRRGYALVTAFCGDLDPDFDDGFQNGVQPIFYKNGQTRPGDDEWGTIGAWAWGLSRALDYLETDPGVDARRVIAFGHSRLGKTALWAAAQDTRFAAAISNESGAGGAALNKRIYGETVKNLNDRFPHWFCRNFRKYNDNEAALPMDAHELIACLAPRPVYVASAEGDQWSDPKGEFLAALGADPVYRLLGVEGLAVREMPAVDRPVISRIGYHIRAGKHDVTAFDWEQYLAFADRYVKGSGRRQ